LGAVSSGRYLPHVDDVEAQVLKAVGNILACLVRGDALFPLEAFRNVGRLFFSR
jgi:hypothetical protein